MSLIQDYFMRWQSGAFPLVSGIKILCWLTGKDLYSVPLTNAGYQVQSTLYYYVQENKFYVSSTAPSFVAVPILMNPHPPLSLKIRLKQDWKL